MPKPHHTHTPTRIAATILHTHTHTHTHMQEPEWQFTIPSFTRVDGVYRREKHRLSANKHNRENERITCLPYFTARFLPGLIP